MRYLGTAKGIQRIAWTRGKLKVLMFTMLTKKNASSRVECYQFKPYLEANGIEVCICPPTSVRLFEVFQEPKRIYFRGQGLLFNLFYWYMLTLPNRLKDLLKCLSYDIVLIQRGMFDYASPPILEWIVTRLNKKVICNFDDAIYLDLPDKMAKMLKMVSCVTVGNKILGDYAIKYNPNVVIIESAVDTDYYTPKDSYETSREVVIGWVGNPLNLKMLSIVEDALSILAGRGYHFVLKIVSSKSFAFKDRRIPVVFKKWSLENEVANLLSFDIGIMPVRDDEYTRAKEGYKIKQYMACGLPVVCSPVGKNKELVKDGENGFWASSDEDWVEKLSMLIKDSKLREDMGRRGREFIERHYSLRRIAPQLKALLEQVYYSH